jgi:hypothetical protein
MDGSVFQMNGEGRKIITNAETQIALSFSDEKQIPQKFALAQNYPNPFNPTTVIKYQLPVNGYVTLKVINLLGQEILTLTEEIQEAGYKWVEFNANSLPSGVYFYRIQVVPANANERLFIDTKKMLLLR